MPHGHAAWAPGRCSGSAGASCLPAQRRPGAWSAFLPARPLTDVTRLSMQDLDNTTFDRIVGQGLPVLVRIDKEYPYGDTDDAWKAVGAVRPTPTSPLPTTCTGWDAPVAPHSCLHRQPRHAL